VGRLHRQPQRSARCTSAVATKNADFFGEYINARMIIDLGERHEKKPEAPKPNP